MISIRILSTVLAAATMAASLPSLAARQSTPAICIQAGKAPYNRGLLQVWDADTHSTLYGYLSPEPVSALVECAPPPLSPLLRSR